jgi:hypothetical protein
MVAVKKKLLDEMSIQDSFLEKGTLLSITGSVFDVVGKIGMAVGTTGILLYAFGMVEAMFALGTLYTGAAVIAVGVVSASIANKLKTGNWFKGLLS